MEAASSLIPLLTATTVVTAGLGSALFARCSEGSRCQTLSQVLFFASLAMVGLAAIGSVLLGPGCWVTCSSTLAVMVIGATYDRRGLARRTA